MEVIISGGNASWVQCDGVQMIADESAAVYDPEDSVWEITKGNYILDSKQMSLWAGERYPTASQVVKPAKTLSECRNGWILQWQRYAKGSGRVDSNYQTTLIPKNLKGRGVRVLLADRWGPVVYKYLYVYDDRMEGHNSNSTGDNHNQALTEVLEW
ncbi:hypothetical protein RWE15_14580 [Virgibacillus halophilus]|uniref:Uncharacterized protein n=1 Tax=Tigheibacillus halophilus TaxID=361280 RepID=A0ABU5C9E0_9BACI|nr:hypothetical protein [Virgibacillus halophilus]